MLKVLKINPDAKIMHVPTDLLDAGFTGDIDSVIGAVTVVLIKPGARMEDAIASLEATLAEMRVHVSERKNKKN